MRILYDCSGGDNAPEEIIKGALLAREKENISPFFVGKRETLIEYLSEEDHKYIIDADEVIENTDEPAVAIRKKPNSSIVVGMKELVKGEYDGFLSAGSTGGLLAGGLFILKRIKGFERAALPVILPTLGGQTMIMDVGANVDTSPELLLSFAKMGAVYLEEIYDLEKARVGLLNVGAEKGKGDKRSQETYLLLENSGLNFVGNIEARDVFSGKVDLLLTDGFAGNILLKAMEGTVAFIKYSLQKGIQEMDHIDESFIGNTGILMKKSLGSLDYRKYGGVPLLGIQKPVVKAHGSSDSFAIYNASLALKEMIEKKVIEKISCLED